ncbi:SH3 domain-containing protein [Georgenia satyanarayanai]|uniref:SH3 domain-containing protein n=1 Tax=Georgenia satyanarayanai TaxID=860221 RepID=UPI00203A70E3|nr:SH3 domain-containing protein [Georgenia satyanarayanai]MCM3662161.1 SH3 domain-containing protein [Georgenia satyanarayanai]
MTVPARPTAAAPAQVTGTVRAPGEVRGRGPAPAAAASGGLELLRLQRQAGNRAVTQLVAQRSATDSSITPDFARGLTDEALRAEIEDAELELAASPADAQLLRPNLQVLHDEEARRGLATSETGPIPPPTTIPDGGEAVGAVGVVNRDEAPEVRLRATPDTEADNVVRGLPFDTHVQVVKQFPGDWYFVATPDGDLGYVARVYVWTQLPDPQAHLHRVASGVAGTAIAVAEQYYSAVSDDWGQDLRFYVNVLAWANGITVPDTTDGWRAVHFEAGRLIWVPGVAFARGLKGVVGSGSVSYDIADAVGVAGMLDRAGELLDDFSTAFGLSGQYMGEAIMRHLGDSFVEALVSLGITLVGAAGILAVSTAIGAGLGALAGGAGAVPGAAAGFEVGMVLLKWLGLGLLIVWVAQSLAAVGAAFGTFLATVWGARGDREVLDRAGRELAEAVGLLLGKLLEALVMYAASLGLGAGLRAFRGSQLGRAFGESRSSTWLTERVRRVQAGEAALPGPREALQYYRGVELVNAGRSPIGEFDGVDLGRGRFVESKSVSGLERVNPRTGQRAQTEAQWANKQITVKTTKRIQALATAVATRPTSGGSSTVPELSRIQQIRQLLFRLDGDSPALRAAVHAELATLRSTFPDWTFTAEFGVRVRLPPLPDAERDRQPVGP